MYYGNRKVGGSYQYAHYIVGTMTDIALIQAQVVAQIIMCIYFINVSECLW